MSKLKIFSLLFVFLTTILTSAHAQVESVDFMRSIGKIYAVVAVIVLIFIGILLFLIYLERKVSRIENQFKNNG